MISLQSLAQAHLISHFFLFLAFPLKTWYVRPIRRSTGAAPIHVPAPSTATWEFEDGVRGSGQWTAFAAATSAKLELTLNAGRPTCTTKWSATKYLVDLRAMTQTNMTVSIRTLRELDASLP